MDKNVKLIDNRRYNECESIEGLNYLRWDKNFIMSFDKELWVNVFKE